MRPSRPARAGRRWIARHAAGAAVGIALTRVLPVVPDRVHPVAWFGRVMTALERRLWRDERSAGAGYAAIGLALGAAAAAAPRSTSLAVAVSAAGPQLRRTASAIADALERDDLECARRILPSLVGRDPAELDASAMAAAAIESLAENTVDAVFAPAWWAVVAGPGGVGAHRAANTMDAMVGRMSPRYRNFGWAAARTDDAANWVPARLYALATAVSRPGRARAVGTAVRADAGAHPSPNAGVAEAAMAGALGRELGGPLRYGDVHEDRPTLGAGPRPDVGDLRTAVALAQRTESLLLAVLVGAAALARWSGDRP